MASGHEDFKNQVEIKGYDSDSGVLRTIAVDGSGNMKIDITAQVAAKVDVRQRVGPDAAINGTSAIVGAGTQALSIKLGTYIIWGGFLHFAGLVSLKNFKPLLSIDSIETTDFTLDEMNTMNLIEPGCYPWYLLKFDDANFLYTVALTNYITCDVSLIVKYSHDQSHTLSYGILTKEF